jgi:hypothetical protein
MDYNMTNVEESNNTGNENVCNITVIELEEALILSQNNTMQGSYRLYVELFNLLVYCDGCETLINFVI